MRKWNECSCLEAENGDLILRFGACHRPKIIEICRIIVSMMNTSGVAAIQHTVQPHLGEILI